MAILDIVQFPDQRLREVCKPVEKIDNRVKQLLNDMAETMYDAPGVGLAASQVGVLERLIVIDLGVDEEAERTARLYKIINPEIVSRDGKIVHEEGCLSIPSIREKVTRSAELTVKALNEEGKEIEIVAEGLLAVCLQHEIDHLNGVLFIDHLSQIKKELVKNKLKKLAQNK
ncbi:MAG: peptide deformylase [Proteobacteria bacterium]|nr:peptide deformylase [Pseudomonadota bacterium]